MDPAAELPDVLPQSFSDYLKWTSDRTGLHRYLCNQINQALGSGVNKGDFATEIRERMKRKLTPRRIENILRDYLSGTRIPDYDVLNALVEKFSVDQKRLSNYFHPPPLDYFRCEWLREEEANNPPLHVDLDNGLVMKRLVPTYPRRELDAYLCRKDTSNSSRYYVHPGDEFCYVVDGFVDISFAGMESVQLETNDGILFDSYHPHKLELSDDAVILSVVSSPGFNSERARHEYSQELLSDGFTHERNDNSEMSLDDLVAFRVAIALSGMYDKRLQGITGIRASRLKNIQAGKTRPTHLEVVRLAHALRLPEWWFLTPLHSSIEEFCTIIRADEFEEMYQGAQVEDLNMPLQRASHQEDFKSKAMHSMLIGIPDCLQLDPGERLLVSAMVVNPRDIRNVQPTHHHEEDPGEEFIYVVDGNLDMSFDLKGSLKRWPTTHFLPGDAVWYTSKVGHGFAASGELPAKLLFFRRLLPSFHQAMKKG